MKNSQQVPFEKILVLGLFLALVSSCTSMRLGLSRVPASDSAEITPGVYQGVSADALKNPMTGSACGIEAAQAENGDLTIPKTISWSLYNGAWGKDVPNFGAKKEALIQYKDFITDELKAKQPDLIEHLNLLNWKGYITWYDEKYDFAAIVGQNSDGTPNLYWLGNDLRRQDHKKIKMPVFYSNKNGHDGRFSCYGLKPTKEIELGGHWRRDYFGWPKMGCSDLYADQVKGLMVPFGAKKGTTLGIAGMTLLSCIVPPICITAYISEGIGFEYAQIQSEKYLYPAGVIGDLVSDKDLESALDYKNGEKKKNYYLDHLLKDMNKKLKKKGKSITEDELGAVVKKLNQDEAFCTGDALMKREPFKKVILDAILAQ